MNRPMSIGDMNSQRRLGRWAAVKTNTLAKRMVTGVWLTYP
jgi:hypothetical protein